MRAVFAVTLPAPRLAPECVLSWLFVRSPTGALLVLSLVSSRAGRYAICCSTSDFVRLLPLLRPTPSDRGAQQSSGGGPLWEPRLRLPEGGDASTYNGSEEAVGGSPPSDPRRYAWCAFHLCALQQLRRMEAATHAPPHASRASDSPADVGEAAPLGVVVSNTHGRADDLLLLGWNQRMRIWSSEIASRLGAAALDLDPTSVPLTASPSQQAALGDVWAHMSSELPGNLASLAELRAAASKRRVQEGAVSNRAGVRHEQRGAIEGASRARRPGQTTLRLNEPLELFSRRGDHVRAVCVNALNGSQLAVSLSRGIHQLELTSVDVPDVSHLPDSGLGAAAASRVAQTDPEAPPMEISVQQSSCDFSARCMCAHPKVRLVCILRAARPLVALLMAADKRRAPAHSSCPARQHTGPRVGSQHAARRSHLSHTARPMCTCG